jgi:O-antigen ligase/polysaccharide polymerase Wzy-like membrane protein
MVLWAVHNGGYDTDTWYWGALVLLAVLTAVVGLGRARVPSRRAVLAIACLAAYVGWSYLSIAWASSKGDALQGSNRALLYLIVLVLFAVLPWTVESALAALLTFTLSVGVIAIDLLYRLAAADGVPQMVIDGRLAAPTGYFNATVALLTTGALLATVLSVRRELPAALRGLLIAIASACLQLAVAGQSRGWLFTLPLVLIATAFVVRNRFRVALAAVIPVLATVAPIHRLLDLYQPNSNAALIHAAQRTGQAALVICFVAFVLGTAVAMLEPLVPQPRIAAGARRRLGAALVAAIVAVSVVGAFAATHGDPGGFIKRQWNGFSHPAETGGSTSHFLTVGSGRYDFWRVALDAALAHPVGGLGQDNYADYYVTRRRSSEEPAWPHSLEMRLLAMTGFVGFAIFAAFVAFALATGGRAVRRRPGLTGAVCAAALLPLIDWLLHGSLDWFWEMPALSGPALAFLGIALSLDSGRPMVMPSAVARLGRDWHGPAQPAIAFLLLVAAAAVLGFPYLSVREVSTASNIEATNPVAALSDLKLAGSLDPLSSEPGRLGGAIALEHGMAAQALSRFQQSINREPGGWYAWFGKGLALSALGDNLSAARALEVAARIERQQPVIREAQARATGPQPMRPVAALDGLLLEQ